VRTRNLDGTDIQVSVVGLGTNNFGRRLDERATRAVVDAALEAGIVFVDTADIYGNRGGSETLLGRALVGRRPSVVLATKFGMDMGDGEERRGSPAYIHKSIQGSLRRLQTDWIDLYQYHQPDGITPIEETLGALNELVREGKVRAIGSSNFSAVQVREARAAAERHGLRPFVSEQSRYSWLQREAEDELLPACEELGVGFIPYSPLANGLLTGKYRLGQPLPEGTRLSSAKIQRSDLERVERLRSFAAQRGVSLLEVAIGGLAAVRPIASVIAGAMTPDQVRANAAAGGWQPSADDISELRAI
jgi:aryl-alcohol dehydrogenase-like predicted oxidoreductase